MKLLHRVFYVTALGTLALQLGSCKKIIDKLHKDPVTTLDVCAITKITNADEGRIFDFTYNSAGDPISVVNNMVETGYPNFSFHYDASGRLIESIAAYTNGNYESWHRYGYDALNRIVKDTQYVFGMMGPEPDPASYFIMEHTYTYDASKRIIKDDIIYLQPASYSPETQNYTYNSSGNLLGGAYDSRVNLHRTNKVWMFMSKDYSRNNRIPATSYNGYSLPLGFNNAIPFNFLGIGINQNSSIQYACAAKP